MKRYNNNNITTLNVVAGASTQYNINNNTGEIKRRGGIAVVVPEVDNTTGYRLSMCLISTNMNVVQ